MRLLQLFYKSPKQETEGPDKPMMLVIVPTREMVLQIAGEMGKYNHKGLRIGVAYGGRGGADVKKKNEEKMAMADTLMKVWRGASVGPTPPFQPGHGLMATVTYTRGGGGGLRER